MIDFFTAGPGEVHVRKEGKEPTVGSATSREDLHSVREVRLSAAGERGIPSRSPEGSTRWANMRPRKLQLQGEPKGQALMGISATPHSARPPGKAENFCLLDPDLFVPCRTSELSVQEEDGGPEGGSNAVQLGLNSGLPGSQGSSSEEAGRARSASWQSGKNIYEE